MFHRVCKRGSYMNDQRNRAGKSNQRFLSLITQIILHTHNHRNMSILEHVRNVHTCNCGILTIVWRLVWWIDWMGGFVIGSAHVCYCHKSKDNQLGNSCNLEEIEFALIWLLLINIMKRVCKRSIPVCLLTNDVKMKHNSSTSIIL